MYLNGFKELPIENITLKNITIDKTTTSYSLKNGKNIVFDNVSINGIILNKKPKETILIKMKTH
ncbi:hypothetical protein [Polaribacter sp. L3A8]|uniref:hypothetical protein n=1 Tax=Polaribacter sp. L3A8 TaxID=2686361 RepID=UPI0018EF029C|nr:hypothetical protein [Polaribacter sp. L3A8]